MARHMRVEDTVSRYDVRTFVDDPRVQLVIGAIIFTVFVIVPFVLLAVSGGVEQEQRYVPAHYETVPPRD